jgi:hypothetical protein
VPAPVRFAFVAEAGQAIRETLAQADAFKTLRTVAAETSAGVTAGAREQVAQLVKEREAIALNIVEYRKLAAAATTGSEEQVAANRLVQQSLVRLGEEYAGVGAAAVAAAREASRAQALAATRSAEESGVVRGFASRTIGVGAFAGGAFIAGAVGGLVIAKAARDAQAAQESENQLANALRNVGVAYKDVRGETQRYLEEQEKQSAFSKIELRGSLGVLVRTTGDLTDAQKLLAQAEDVSRGRHVSLNTATTILTRAYFGNVGGLRRLGINVQAVTTEQDKLRNAHVKATPELARQAKALDTQATAVKALAQLDDRYSGSAAAHARTLAGRQEALANAFEDVSVQIGYAVTPALTEMFGWMTKEVKAAQHSKDLHAALHGTFKVLGFILRDLVAPMIRFTIEEWKFWIRTTQSVVDFVHNDVIPAFRTMWNFILRTGRAAWAAIIQISKGAVYVILQVATAAIRGILELASHLPFVGDKARAALNSINGYLRHWKPDFSRVDAAFRAGGTSAGEAFARAAADQMSKPGTYVPAHRAGPRGQTQGAYVNTTGDVQGKTGKITPGLGAVEQAVGGQVYDDYATSGHARNSYHYRGEAADLAPDPDVWARLYAHKHAFAELFGPTRLRRGGLYHYGVQFYDAALQREHQNHIHVAYTGGPKAIDRMFSGGGGGGGHGGGGAVTPPANYGATQGGVDAGIAGAPSSGAGGPGRGGRLTAASAIALRGEIDQLLRAVPAETDPAIRNAVAHLRRIRAQIHAGLSSTQAARDRNQIREWSAKLRQAIKDEMAKIARQWEQGFQTVTTRLDRAIAEHWQKVQNAFDAQTQAGLQKFVVAQTPAEKALADFQAKLDAQQQAADMASAQAQLATARASGDTSAIATAQQAVTDLQNQAQIRALQAAADASRAKQDEITKRQQDAYQQQRDAQWQALQDLHDDQVAAFDRDLQNWDRWLGAKKRSWAQFLAFLHHNPVSDAIDTSGVANPRKPRKPHKQAAGGDYLVHAPTLFMAGEAGTERATFTPVGAGAPGGGGDTTLIERLYVLGTTDQEVARALARIVTPAQRRQITLDV